MTVGHVTELWRYPVKSMAGEPLDRVEVGWHGFVGDRRWAFIREGAVQSGFPWFTLRQNSDMRLYRPSHTDPARPDSSPTVVATPSGATFDVADPALAAELAPGGARVVRQDRGVFDTFPVSLISTQTVERLGEQVGRPLDVGRFRPNIVMTAAAEEAFVEDALVGAVIRIGGLRIRLDKRDSRCVVITIDPETGEKDPSVLRAVAAERVGISSRQDLSPGPFHFAYHHDLGGSKAPQGGVEERGGLLLSEARVDGAEA